MKNAPGPGAYEVPVSWAQMKPQSRQGSACFLSPSRNPRKVSKGSTRPASKGAKAEISSAKQSQVVDRNRKHSPCAIFTRSDRGLLSSTNHSSAKEDTEVEHSEPGLTSWLGPNPVIFCRSSRGLDCNGPRADDLLSPASYPVKRLWDRSPKTGVSSIDVPSPAVFGASHEQRRITWTPSLTPPTHGVPDAWDSSRHYAKHKSKVIKQKMFKQKAVLYHHHAPASTIRSKHATSAHEHLGIPQHDDPFEWLRHQRHGDQRVHLLTSKHSLVDHFKSLSHLPAHRSHDETPPEQQAHQMGRHQSLPELHASDLDDDDIHKVRPKWCCNRLVVRSSHCSIAIRKATTSLVMLR